MALYKKNLILPIKALNGLRRTCLLRFIETLQKATICLAKAITNNICGQIAHYLCKAKKATGLFKHRKIKIICKSRFQVQMGVAWRVLRSRREIAHVAIWQLKPTSVVTAEGPRTQPTLRRHWALNPRKGAGCPSTACIGTCLGMQVRISESRFS